MRNDKRAGCGFALCLVFWMPSSFCGCTANETTKPASTQPSHFIEVDEVSGIPCDETLPVVGDRFMPESMAGGCVLFDCDGDGDLDLYHLKFARPSEGVLESDAGANRLYRQDGPWSFTDITEESKLGDRGYAMGAASGDIDNDGDLDLTLIDELADVVIILQQEGLVLPDFIRGDASWDGEINIADAVMMLTVLFGGGCGTICDCPDALDANDDSANDISDPIYVLMYLFSNGNPPPPPFPACGTDPTTDSLDCLNQLPCT